MRIPGRIIVEKNAHGKDRYVVDCMRMKLEIPDQSKIKAEMLNKKCTVEWDQDRLDSIELGRQKIIFKPANTKSTLPGKGKADIQANQRSQQNLRKQSLRETQFHKNLQPSGGRNLQEEKDAVAPYNFIPLNATIVPSEHKDPPSFAVYRGWSGYINLDIEAITPIYVGGSEENLSADKNVRSFFGPGGITKIPGSSIRGMVRNLVEIASYSKMGAIDSAKNLYYRGLADTSSLGTEYTRNLVTHDPVTGKPASKSSAGYLRKQGRNYYISPAIREGGKQYIPVEKDKHSHEEFVIRKRDDGKYLVISGNMQGKHRDWLINAPDEALEKRIWIPAEDIYSYEYDVSRMADKKVKDEAKRKDGDLLRILKYRKDDNQVPCFYVQWKDSANKDRVSFGHTGYFRLAYKQSIGEHLDSEHKNSELMDMATAIFGISEKKQVVQGKKNNTVAGRVYFDDALLVNRLDSVEMKPMSPQILSGPKPTTFQHYLTQSPDAAISRLNHWNSSDGKLRGNKLYWHKTISSQDEYIEKSDSNWREKEPEYNSSQHIVIKPLKEKSRFSGRIRFENLSRIELGALLFVLALPPDHFHKHGMGKPLGMGSVKIVPQLYTCDRQNRYSSLFKDGKFHTGLEKKEIAGFVKAFEQYIFNRLPQEEQGVKEDHEVSFMANTKIERFKDYVELEQY